MTLQIEKPRRRRHTYVQTIHAAPDVAFPLLCPVLEVDWVPGWMPNKVISESGVAEKDCVFVTPAEPHDAVWIVTEHDPENLRVEMHKVIPEHTVTRLEASLAAAGKDTTEVTITYEYTALGPDGEEFLKTCTTAWYEEFMTDWEDAMNRYLANSGDEDMTG